MQHHCHGRVNMVTVDDLAPVWSQRGHLTAMLLAQASSRLSGAPQHNGKIQSSLTWFHTMRYLISFDKTNVHVRNNITLLSKHIVFSCCHGSVPIQASINSCKSLAPSALVLCFQNMSPFQPPLSLELRCHHPLQNGENRDNQTGTEGNIKHSKMHRRI